jgi:hypothetical protein
MGEKFSTKWVVKRMDNKIAVGKPGGKGQPERHRCKWEETTEID